MSHSQCVWLRSADFAAFVSGGEASVRSGYELSIILLEPASSLSSSQHGEDESEVGGFLELCSC